MAKSSRSSTVKANNQRLKAKVFSPVEEERNARLSAKLLALAAQPKPEPPVDTKAVSDDEDDAKADEESHDDTAMDLDNAKSIAAAAAIVASKRSHKKRIEKRRKTSKIVFPKYKDRVTKRRKN